MALRLVGLLESLELGAYDRFLRLRTSASIQDSPIVLVRIYEEDIRRFGHPISDELLTGALAMLLDAEPRAIGVDLYRDAPVPRAARGSDLNGSTTTAYAELGKAVTRTDRVVMVMKFPNAAGVGTPPPSFLEGTHRVGFSDLPVDPGGAIRRGLLFLWDGDAQYLSLSLQLALRYLRDEGIALERDPAVPNHVRLGSTTIPPFQGNDGGYVRADDGGYQFLLDYRTGSNSFASFSLQQLLEGAIVAEEIRDKIVIVGTTAPSVKDQFYSPYSQSFREDQVTYGVEIHAQAASQLLRFARGHAQPIASMAELGEILWILFWSLLGAALGLWNRSTWVSSLAALGGVGALVAAGLVAFAQSWWIPVVPPVLAGLGSAGLVTAYVAVAERAERRQIASLFSRFLGPEVVGEIWTQRDRFMRRDHRGRPRSQRVTLTVLVADLAGFTRTAERMEPDSLMSWVNEFMSAMGNLIESHGGVVDDYAGDGIKANFGFPVPRTREEEISADALNAIRCALAMGEEMERLNEKWRRSGFPPGRVRIGIFTGPAVAGVLGSEHHLKYTSIGDTVNTASRLESFDKDGFASDPSEVAWRILAGEETQRHLRGAFQTVDLGLHELRGKELKIRIYRVLALSNRNGEESREGKQP
jgi:adenylate cyclase